MSQRTPSHCSAISLHGLDDRAAQPRVEGIELEHVGPGREVRVPAAGQHLAPRPRRTRPDRGAESSSSPWMKYSGCVGTQGGRAPRGWGRNRGSSRRPRSRELFAGGRQPRRAARGARRRRSGARSRASRHCPRPRSRAGRGGNPRAAPRSAWRSSIPAGLRSQTPMNQTASKPQEAIRSHSSGGTVARSTGRRYFRPSSPSQTQVLIS